MYDNLLPGTKVQVQIPVCPCTGKSHIIQVAKIIKAFNVNNTTWYFLDNNRSVHKDNVIKVIE